MFERALATCKEYRNSAEVHRDDTMKAKVLVGWNVSRNGGPLLTEMGALVTEDTEKVVLINALCDSVLPLMLAPVLVWG